MRTLAIATRVLTLTSVLLASLTVPLFAGEKKNEPVGKSSGSAASIDWQISADHDRLLLTVAGPDGRFYSKEFAGGKPVTFRASDLDKAASDGTYVYELRLVPRISADVKRRLANARADGNDEDAARIQQEAGIRQTTVQSGAFTVKNGGFILSDAAEPDANDSAKAIPDGGTGASSEAGTTSAAKFGPAVSNANVIADDLIVQGSECVGIDCTATESFGFDTVRLKENNLRINFDDTSTSAGFPSTDWRLSANDSASGGANKFTIEDATNSKVPFTVMGNAPTNAMFLSAAGDLGLGTATPALDVHVNTGNTPAIRLAQDNTGGFTAQTWDIGANEANFFVRDLTGGSKLSFRIRPGAPTSSIDIAANGDVGIGTASPAERVHAFENADTNTLMQVENPNTGTSTAAVVRAKADVATVNFQAHASTRTLSRFGVALGGYNEMLAVNGNGLLIGTNTAVPVIIGTNQTARMTIDSTGNITVPGNFTVTGVKNFAVVDPADDKQSLYYTALEGPEAGTYYRGTARTVNGEAVIELPGYFARLTEAERMTVQLTPVGDWAQLYVASRTPEKLVIKAKGETTDLEFDYFVQGVRKGYLDYEVERVGAFPVKK